MEYEYETDYPNGIEDDSWWLRLVGPALCFTSCNESRIKKDKSYHRKGNCEHEPGLPG